MHTQALLWKDDMQLYYRVMRRVFDQLFGTLRMQRVGRALFDPNAARENELLGVDIWPGHEATLTLREDGIMLQVSSVHQVIRRTETVLDKIRMIKEANEARGRDYVREVTDAVVGQDIVTTYNKRTYRVDDIAFDRTPDSTFTLMSQGEEFHVSFADYLRSQHKVDVLEANQPMLVIFDTRREQIIHLVPEHCRFVGLTDEIMDDFKAFREVRFSRRTDAPVKIKESTEFVKIL